jgi:hypothetical protein
MSSSQQITDSSSASCGEGSPIEPVTGTLALMLIVRRSAGNSTNPMLKPPIIPIDRGWRAARRRPKVGMRDGELLYRTPHTV